MVDPLVFTPCSPRHRSCSPAHAALVRGYREERERQESLFEEHTGAYRADEEHAKAKGHTMIDFHVWLRANKGAGQ